MHYLNIQELYNQQERINNFHFDLTNKSEAGSSRLLEYLKEEKEIEEKPEQQQTESRQQITYVEKADKASQYELKPPKDKFKYKNLTSREFVLRKWNY